MVFEIFQLSFGLFGDDFNLLYRKTVVSTLTGQSSLSLRQDGITDGLILLLTSPVGYPFNLSSGGNGWLYAVSAYSGWLGVFIFLAAITRVFRKTLNLCDIKYISIAQKYGAVLMVSLLFVALFISGYGWERPVGYIMIFLYFRIVCILVKDFSSPAS